MASKKRKRPVPLLLFWSKQGQRRFVDAVERLYTVLGDVEMLVRQPAERARAAAATRAARQAADQLAAINGQIPATSDEVIARVTGVSAGRLFDMVWRTLADEGKCDGYGGAEYRRVKEEWFQAGCPPIQPHILESANRGPFPTEVT